MRTATIHVSSIGPYSQSKFYDVPKIGTESMEAYKQRTWRLHCHTDKNGHVIIPPMAVKNGLVSAAKFLGMKVRGKGQATYTKRFESGVITQDPLVLPLHIDDVVSESLFLPSDGVRGSGKRVVKIYPVIPEWSGAFKVVVIDEKIEDDIMAEHAEAWGKFIGIGRFRPEKNGFYGRFVVDKIKWE